MEAWIDCANFHYPIQNKNGFKSSRIKTLVA